MDYNLASLDMHKDKKGKLEIASKVSLENKDDLSTAYTPGVAEPCRVIAKDPDAAYTYTIKQNMVAVVTDGSAVLGLGNIGGLAGLPVMEGKAILFKKFGGVDAFPICLDTQDPDEIVRVVKAIAPTFGGINLEDIKAPQCFEIEARLKKELDIPVFHDDQHGTAIVVLAALTNALKIVKKDISTLKVVINGAGAAGAAIAKLLLEAGVADILMIDSQGIICDKRDALHQYKQDLLTITNKQNACGSLADAMQGADVFVGVSQQNLVSEDMVKSMNKDAIIFAMANPVPEIMPDLAKQAGAAVVGTGRSDFPNQINNVLAFPGLFRGVLDARAPAITEEMKLAAAAAIAACVPPDKLSADNIIPSPLDKSVATAVAEVVRTVAEKSLGNEC